ncbi:hypothetical protein ACFL27_04975 [candidate division CSSED10-310 bacterium]|uniref:Acyl-CoA-binding protein n=1 Tax=candidate division CSSED10-310 bacterium TaxID=2855610 RepID=A0ABV6YTL8_UNCC1
MMTTKELAKQVIDTLPEDANLDQIMYALYVTRKFRKGAQEIEEGKGVTHEEAKRRLEKWLK